MNLGKMCMYAKECPVYNNSNDKTDKPVFIIRNVFCNRGARGWNNCLRFLSCQQGKAVTENMTPYG